MNYNSFINIPGSALSEVHSLPNMHEPAPVQGCETLRLLREDIQDSESKLQTYGSIAGFLAVQAVGAAKLPTAVALPLALKVQKDTGVPIEAGAAVAGAYGSWTLLSAGANSKFVEHLPKTFEHISDGLPKITEATKKLPGVNTDSPSENLLSDVKTRMKRGMATYTVGTMVYAAAAGLQKQSRKNRRNLVLNLGADGGAAVGSIATLATTGVMAFEQTAPGMTEAAVNYAGNPFKILGTMAAIAAGKWGHSYTSNKLEKLKPSRQSEVQLPETAAAVG